MAITKNECEIVNRLSRKVEKDLADNMAQIEEEIEDMAVIDDTTESLTKTWSSEKISAEIEAGSGSDLIDDTTESLTKTWSSEKISNEIDSASDLIDDTTESLTKTWSSEKINAEIEAGGGGSDVIDDTTVTTTTTFSSSKIVDLLYSVLSGESKYIAINTTIERVTASYSTVQTISNLNLNATSKGVLNLNFSVTAGSGHPGKELLITGIKSDNTSYTISDTLIPRSETSTQEYTLNIPDVEFEDNTTQIKIEIKNTEETAYSATFRFTGYLNTLAI